VLPAGKAGDFVRTVIREDGVVRFIAAPDAVVTEAVLGSAGPGTRCARSSLWTTAWTRSSRPESSTGST